MSQTAPPSNKTDKPAASPSAPPDERFWQRYSPHAEFPLSSAGSFVVHILLFGLLLLASFLGTLLFHTNRQVPIEAVQFSGGGGNPHGREQGPNTGEPVEANDQSKDKQATDTVPPDEVPPPKLDIKPEPTPKPDFKEEPGRRISREDAANTLQQLRMRAGKIRSPGSTSASSPGFGKGGPGQGGGSGKGTGVGIGDNTGPGAATPTQREKRGLRWSMLFNTPDTANYVAQLRGLGAILAIPVREDAANGVLEYKIVRDLSARPAKLTDEDIGSILNERLVRWVDENPDSVRGVMSVLGLKLKPSHFLAFMPPELESKLLKLEIAHLHKRYPSRHEDDIEWTKFRIKVLANGKYEPEVKEQKLK